MAKKREMIQVKDDHGYPIWVAKPKEKSTTKSESQIQKEIADLLMSEGWEVDRYNCMTKEIEGENGGKPRFISAVRNLNTGMTTGHSDLEAKKNCICLRIECKTEKGKLSPDQKKRAELAIKHGNPIVVLRSKDEAKKLLNLMQTATTRAAITIFQNSLKG